MARQTRAQRKARRQAQAESGVAQRSRPQPVRPAPAEQPQTHAVERRAPTLPGTRFVSESWGELKKVEWPGQKQVITGTVAVLVACAIVGTYLYAADKVVQPLVRFLVGQ